MGNIDNPSTKRSASAGVRGLRLGHVAGSLVVMRSLLASGGRTLASQVGDVPLREIHCWEQIAMSDKEGDALRQCTLDAAVWLA